MKILEVRDGFIKIETKDNITLSSFLKITDNNKSYISQIIQTKQSGEYNVFYAKILFNYDGMIVKYDKSLPSKDSEIENFDFSELKKNFETLNPLNVGSFICDNTDILIDKNCLNNNLLVSIDSEDTLNILVSNLSKQFKKTLIIDMLGNISAKKFIAGQDFRLPLNTASLDFIYEDCLNDATSDSKSLIKEIFKDLSEYSKTVPFLPFETLKTIIDDMVDKSHIFKLLVLKNKLSKFAKMGYFASNQKEAENLKKILMLENVVIDISKLDPIFQNRYLNIIYTILETLDETQVIVNVSNSINKKNLKNLLTNEKIKTGFITHSKFKYLNEMKNFYKNYIIEPNFNNNEIFKHFSVILKAINKDNYLIVGEATNYIPLISNIKILEELTPEKDSVILNNEDFTAINTEENINNENIETVKEENLTDINDNSTEEQDLEQALNNSELTINTIEKKSENIIEKVSEEILYDNSIEKDGIFNSDDNDEITENENEITEYNLTISESEAEITPAETEAEHIEEQKATILETNEINSDFEEEIVPEIIEDLPETINDEIIEEIAIEDGVSEEDLDNDSTEELIETTNEIDITENDKPEYHTKVDEIQAIEIPEDILEMSEEASLEIENPDSITIELAEESSFESLTENENTIKEPVDSEVQENENFILSEDDNTEAIELEDSELDEDIIVVNLEEDEEYADDIDIEKEIIEDVDKVFTTQKDDSISDSDLDFIDTLNNDFDNENDDILLQDGNEELSEYIPVELPEENIDDEMLEPIEEINLSENTEEKEVLETKNTSTPIVPVYGADIPEEDIVSSDPIEQGDTVFHAKYGTGVVEKMIKYGTKSLYSINFDNVGRRLLDPTLTEIKKA